MQFKCLVRPEHLNHNGYLFGGYMLKWVDEYAYLAALEDYPSGHFVTRGMDAVSFEHSVDNGDVLTFDVVKVKTGHSSVTYAIHVSARAFPSGHSRDVFSTKVTMCNVDKQGHKALLPDN